MRIRISELKLKPDHKENDLEKEIRKALRLKNEPMQYEIIRRSIDARKKPDLYYVYTIDVSIKDPKYILKRSKNKKASLIDPPFYNFNAMIKQNNRESSEYKPIIIGSGPAGLFCALMLARAGYQPVVLERGECVEDRIKSVEAFWQGHSLNLKSNVQFGEGGAGTFSDGKLNTLVKDTSGRIRYVLKEFVNAGANPEICYHHKPHIGTDVLTSVVQNIRNEIIRLGGKVLFKSCVTDLHVKDTQRHIYELSINEGEQILYTKAVILAIGHSARDTFHMLSEFGLSMEAKSFAVGLRIQHDQKMIDDAMYGSDCPYEMDAAPYKVTHKCENGRGVYSFCMCPGGYVVNASSENGMTAINGMSYSGRDSGAANSAIVVTVTPEDYGNSDDPLAGIDYQRMLEKRAHNCAEGKIPVQRFEDFKANIRTEQLGSIRPVVKGQYALSNVRSILPEELNNCMIDGITAFSRKIQGFGQDDTLLMGVESRTSSPVRILRNDALQSNYTGIFPCGEGAGYAGGITSAAADGIRVAEAVSAYLDC